MEVLSNEQLKKLLSRKLSLLRKKSGKTIEATADSLDMDFSEYYRMLRGKNLPQLRTLLRFSKRYGVTLDWWFKELRKIPPEISENIKRLHRKNIESKVLNALRQLDTRHQEVVLDTVQSLIRRTKSS
jgi:transcriptional regulator with XRE-family HTH domain